ncbi:hypothetical protein K443DRAFT_676235 [Laccaria amethystina LaAM-08-1]|uniref:Ser-Thr-rich glycosyl-phosphatidyl-inositol-anchored membrane family-domain-containing protein n=1 Tax=Laccaria amethystina LaAM-08-1 TaxID=1095629 RepID=A0A0C9Y7U4_9AGAR|nr:hypothetical protein K443DRAFT_676235 [Laccaria amethystina LaAM-08-1]
MFGLLKLTTALCFAYTFLAQVHASPLSRRDVVAPHITSPDASSVWPIGTMQLVTWDTSDLPPDSQITNPIGQIILGFNESNSLNLDFTHPLAQGFNMHDRKVQITVPNVPPRTDYLIVLFGDSGNTSPSFAITAITAGTSPAASSTSTDWSSPPLTGSVITGGISESMTTTSSPGVSTTAPVPTSTTSGSSSSSSSSSAPGSAAAASASTTGQSSAAWSVHRSTYRFKILSWGMASAVLLALFF